MATGLLSLQKQAAKQHDEDVATIMVHSNQVADVTRQLEEQKQKTLALEKDVTVGKEEIAKLSNSLSQPLNRRTLAWWKC